MKPVHDLESKDGIKICKSCGLAVHKDGAQWLGGYEVKGNISCSASNKEKKIM